MKMAFDTRTATIGELLERAIYLEQFPASGGYRSDLLAEAAGLRMLAKTSSSKRGARPMTRPRSYVVHYGPARTARFSHFGDALDFAREQSRRWPGHVEVRARDGLVGQFHNGEFTREFAHVEALTDHDPR